MKLEVGKSYLNRNGAEVRIHAIDPYAILYPYLGDNDLRYQSDGSYHDDYISEFDLVSIVDDKPVTGLKFDQGKPDLSLISRELMEEVALVRMFGLTKYSRDNWKLGFKVTRSCAAALRHIFAFLSGETNDAESGCSHLAHAICCLEHALYDMKHRPETNDDRKSQ